MGPPKDQSNHHSFSPSFHLLPPTSVSSKLSCSTVYFKSSRASWWEASFLTQECLVTVEVGFPWTTSHFKDTFKLKCSPQGKRDHSSKWDFMMVFWWRLSFWLELIGQDITGISKVNRIFLTTLTHTFIFIFTDSIFVTLHHFLSCPQELWCEL